MIPPRLTTTDFYLVLIFCIFYYLNKFLSCLNVALQRGKKNQFACLKITFLMDVFSNERLSTDTVDNMRWKLLGFVASAHCRYLSGVQDSRLSLCFKLKQDSPL